MKNFLLYCLFVVFLFFPISVIHADEETENPTMKTTVTFSLSETLSAAVQNITFNIVGEIIPIAAKPNEFRFVDMMPFNPFLENIRKFSTSNFFTDAYEMIPYTSQNRESAKYCARLVVQWPNSDKRTSYYFRTDNSTQFSENIDYTQRMFANLQTLGAQWGLYNLEANEQGKIVLDKSEKFVRAISDDDCGGDAPGESIATTTTTGIDDTASFQGDNISGNFSTFFQNAANIAKKLDIYARLDVTKKYQFSNIALMALGGAKSTLKNVTDELLQFNRGSLSGWPAMFLSDNIIQPGEINAASDNEIALANGQNGKSFLNVEPNVKGAFDNIKLAACTTVSDIILQKPGVGDSNKSYPLDVCDPSETVATCSTDTLPDLRTTSCNLCNGNNAGNMPGVFVGSLPQGIPPTLVDILKKVGATFNVPPASILSVMYHEGAFTRDWFTGDTAWTDDNVKKWSYCGASIPQLDGSNVCDPKLVDYKTCGQGGSGSSLCGTSIAGFGWLPFYFWQGDESSGNWSAVMEIDPGRTRETISPCNVLDSAAATAKLLSSGVRYVPPAVRSPQCFGVPMQQRFSPASCNTWTDDEVFQSHVSYAGYCPQTGLTGGFPPNDAYKDMVLEWYNAFNCSGN